MKNDYTLNTQLDAWLDGIYSEIKFWNNMLITDGGVYDKNKWHNTIKRNRPFILEDDIPSEMYGTEYHFIDVGSGPFSRCGFITDKVNLFHTALDPLAEVYAALKKNFNIETEINLKTGFVELLDKYLKPNSYDMVHMSNSLDHCFDPVLGIYQLINICKIGGKIILRHKENEAEVEKYEGFHQWNLSVDVDKNQFTIWRDDEKYNINEIFTEYVDITCEVDKLEPILNRVEMKKKKDISIPDNNLYDIMLSKVYPFMLKTIMNDVLANVNSPKDVYINKVLSQMESVSSDELRQYIINNKYNKIAIYGMGKIGMKLADVLLESGIEITFIDKRPLTYRNINTIQPDDYVADNTTNAIITPFNGQEAIKNWFYNIGFENPVFSVSEFYNNIKD